MLAPNARRVAGDSCCWAGLLPNRGAAGAGVNCGAAAGAGLLVPVLTGATAGCAAGAFAVAKAGDATASGFFAVATLGDAAPEIGVGADIGAGRSASVDS